jgi:hypothetical protein
MQEGGRSPLAPYMNGLPLQTQVASYYDLPQVYMPLIQNQAMVREDLAVKQLLPGEAS